MRQVGRDALQLAGRQWRPPGSAPPRWRYVLDCSVEAPVTSQSSTMPPVRGHSREGPVVERLVAPCALCGCIPPLWFPRPTFVRIPVAGRKLPSPFHPRPSVKGRRRSALSIPWLCPGPRCPHARTAALRLASCHVAASRSRHASAVTWPPTRPSALLFSSFLRAQAPCLRRRGLAPAGRSPCSSCSRPDARACSIALAGRVEVAPRPVCVCCSRSAQADGL